MRRFFIALPMTLALAVVLSATLVQAQSLVPAGLVPGENYHLIFTTSSVHDLDTFTFVPF